ncbi:MAG: hypothetical protein KDA65_17150 [Planctomycetaceae bacterium]|nr:hypothetical protein [Planctomycetaceae bacterium]
MSVLNERKRRTAANRLANHAEACEVRVLLSGNAIYPQQAVVNHAEAVQPEGKVDPLLLSSSDYNGTWDVDGNSTLELSVKGSNPEKAKVNGTFTTPFLVEGSVKFKGKVSSGIELDGKYHGHMLYGPTVVKLNVQLSAHLTDSTHFAGILHVVLKSLPKNDAPITATKI